MTRSGRRDMRAVRRPVAGICFRPAGLPDELGPVWLRSASRQDGEADGRKYSRSGLRTTPKSTRIPDPPEGLLPVDRAIALAMQHAREGAVSTRWSSDATRGAPCDPLPSDPSWAGGSLYVDARISAVRASRAALWRVIEGIGGKTGWYSFPTAWAVRGLLDRLAGGVGRRGQTA